MSFLKNPFKTVKTLFTDPAKFLQNSLPTIGAVIGTTIAPGIGTAIGAGLGETGKDLAEGQSIGSSLKQGAFSGAGAYAGSALGDFAGNSLGGGLGRTVGDVGFSNIPSGAIGSFVQNALPASLANASIGSVLGGAAGFGLANNAVKSDRPQQAENPVMSTNVTPFTPKQQDEQQTPASLTGLGSLTDQQKSSNLASQGVYGGGNGAQEQSYFTNLLNRRLVDSGGNVSDLSSVSPIEQSYLQKLGISGYGNSKDLLEAISKWKPA